MAIAWGDPRCVFTLASTRRSTVVNAWKFVQVERARRGDIDKGVVHEGLGFRPDRGGGDWSRAVLLKVHVRDAADVPELKDYAPALGVYGVGDLAPAADLFRGIDAGGVLVALALLRDLGRLGDEDSGLWDALQSSSASRTSCSRRPSGPSS
jgi:hypothetical protein